MQYHSHKIWIFWDEKGICQAKYFVVAGLYVVLILFTLLGFVSPSFVFLCEIFIHHWVLLQLANCPSDLEKGIKEYLLQWEAKKKLHTFLPQLTNYTRLWVVFVTLVSSSSDSSSKNFSSATWGSSTSSTWKWLKCQTWKNEYRPSLKSALRPPPRRKVLISAHFK